MKKKRTCGSFDFLRKSEKLRFSLFHGDPVGTLIEPPETVARVLYVLASIHDYSLPEIPPEVIKEAVKTIDYRL